MNRRSLGIIAIVLVLLMVIIATAGLDNLPRQLRSQVTAANTKLNADRTAYEQNRQWIEQEIRTEPDLFGTKAAAWRMQLDQDRNKLAAAATALAALQPIVKANRRADADKVTRGLSEFETSARQPLDDEAQIRTEAEHWLTWKRELPQRADAMRASYDTVKSFDFAAATPTVQKAMTDWPAKKDDLQSRLDALKKVQADGEQVWDSAAPLRAKIEDKQLAAFDYAAFFTDADKLDADAKQLKSESSSLNTLAGQLYTSWDRVVENVEHHNGYEEKIRTVRTTYPDATLANGQVSTDDQWVNIDKAQFREAQRSIGMDTAHKPAGKYDSEAENVVQPAQYAYMAPPGQSNHYGSWVNGVWQWLPAYLILSHALHTWHGPVTIGDYDAYRYARQRGEIFYGRNDEFRPHWGGSGGIFRRSIPVPSSRPYVSGGSSGDSTGQGWYHERPKPSFGSGGGFGGSKYQSRGGFAGSKYQSRGGFSGFGRSYSRGFGGGFRGRR